MNDQLPMTNGQWGRAARSDLLSYPRLAPPQTGFEHEYEYEYEYEQEEDSAAPW